MTTVANYGSSGNYGTSGNGGDAISGVIQYTIDDTRASTTIDTFTVHLITSISYSSIISFVFPTGSRPEVDFGTGSRSFENRMAFMKL